MVEVGSKQNGTSVQAWRDDSLIPPGVKNELRKLNCNKTRGTVGELSSSSILRKTISERQEGDQTHNLLMTGETLLPLNYQDSAEATIC